jgi:hypothetical protein
MWLIDPFTIPNPVYSHTYYVTILLPASKEEHLGEVWCFEHISRNVDWQSHINLLKEMDIEIYIYIYMPIFFHLFYFIMHSYDENEQRLNKTLHICRFMRFRRLQCI